MSPEHKIMLLQNMLRKCGEQFRRYERLHLAKDTDDARAKADVNADFAEECEETIKATEEG